MCVFAQSKSLLILWSWFLIMLKPPQWEIRRHKHLMTERDESGLNIPGSKANRISLHVSIFTSLPHASTQGHLLDLLHEHSLRVLPKTCDWRQWDFPTMLKRKFVPVQGRINTLFGRLCCLIFQFSTVQRWHLWEGIIDSDLVS